MYSRLLNVLLFASVAAIFYLQLTNKADFPWIVLIYAGMSLVSYYCYYSDKSAARSRQWRAPEKTLLLMDLLGGWPGGYVAQKTYRHKTSKSFFKNMFRLIILMHVAAWVGWFYWMDCGLSCTKEDVINQIMSAWQYFMNH